MKIIIIGIVTIGLILSLAAGTFSYQQTYNQNCLESGGKVTGFLHCTMVFEDFAAPEQVQKSKLNETLERISHKYGVDTDDLVTRTIKLTSQVATQQVEQSCIQERHMEGQTLPEELISTMNESLQDLKQGHRDHDSDGFLDRYGTYLSLYHAANLLQGLSFDTKQIRGEFGFPKQNDTEYVFECILNHESNQYKIIVTFQTHYDSYSRLVFVNFTENHSGQTSIKGNDLTLYTGGFNHTVIFANKLDHTVNLSINNVTDFRAHQYIPESMSIPPHKVWMYDFRSQLTGKDAIVKFTASPDNLSGLITIKQYPHCMTQNEVQSLYGQVGAHPRFPSYLPEGYSYECGLHNMNSFVHMTYWNEELHKKFDDKRNDGVRKEFFTSGGIAIDYYNSYIMNQWNFNPDYDKEQFATRDNYDHPYSYMLRINGEPAMMAEKFFWHNGTQDSYKELQIYLDNEVLYRVRSGLPDSEIIRIAESLF